MVLSLLELIRHVVRAHHESQPSPTYIEAKEFIVFSLRSVSSEKI